MNPTNQIIIHQMMPAVFLCLVREIIFGGDAASWLIAIPSVLLARIAFGRFRSERRPAIRMSRLPGFVVWLLCQSLRGSVDMASRTLHLPVQPGFPQANPTCFSLTVSACRPAHSAQISKMSSWCCMCRTWVPMFFRKSCKAEPRVQERTAF